MKGIFPIGALVMSYKDCFIGIDVGTQGTKVRIFGAVSKFLVATAKIIPHFSR